MSASCAGSSGSPTYRYQLLTICGFAKGGSVRMKVARFEMPT